MAFPCDKIGPMVTGEGAFGKPPLAWRDNCVTAANVPIGKGMALDRMMETRSPFQYRWGVENQYGHNQTAIDEWLHSFNVSLNLEPCRW